MLCSLRTPRPDKLLQKRLIWLAYALIGLTVALVLFLMYPEYRLLLVFTFILTTVCCLLQTIKTITAAEEAITYGGFANEIIRNDDEIIRIDNPDGEPVLQNEAAEEMFHGEALLAYLEKHLSAQDANRTAFHRLKAACADLTREKVTLALNQRHDDAKIFASEEWFTISVKPLYLKKTDIFEGRFSVKAIKKYTYLLWRIEDITARKNMEQVFQEERKSLHDFLDYLPSGSILATKITASNIAIMPLPTLWGMTGKKSPAKISGVF